MSAVDQVPAKPSGELIRFDFDDASGHAVRGAALRFDDTWQRWIANRSEAESIIALLGQATVALPLMAAHLKFRGKMNLQFQHGAGIDLLLAQIDHRLRLRSTVKLTRDAAGHLAGHVAGDSEWSELSRGGQLAILLEPETAKDRYQALVPSGSDTLAQDLVGYFEQSEQLPTRLWLAANRTACAGLLIQQMPHAAGDAAAARDSFETLATMGDTVSDEELLTVDAAELAHRLFATEGLRMHDARAVDLACNCGRDRVAALLLSLGQAEVDAALREQDTIDITCEFCQSVERFDQNDCKALFDSAAQTPPTDSKH